MEELLVVCENVDMWLPSRHEHSVVNEWRYLRLRIAGGHNIIRVASGDWRLELEVM